MRSVTTDYVIFFKNTQLKNDWKIVIPKKYWILKNIKFLCYFFILSSSSMSDGKIEMDYLINTLMSQVGFYIYIINIIYRLSLNNFSFCNSYWFEKNNNILNIIIKFNKIRIVNLRWAFFYILDNTHHLWSHAVFISVPALLLTHTLNVSDVF